MDTVSFKLSDYQLRTLTTLTGAQSPVLVFVPVISDLKTIDHKCELGELVALGLLTNDTEKLLKESAIAKGFSAYTLTQQGMSMFWDSYTSTAQ